MSKITECASFVGSEQQVARKNLFYFLLAIAVFVVITFLPDPPNFQNGTEVISLSFDAKIVIASLCFAVVLWMTEAIPFPATSLLLIIILHSTNIGSFNELVKTGFGNNVLLFLMGAMGLSAAMTSSGLAKRFMLILLSRVGRRTDYIIFAFMATGTLLSMWVTDMAVAAMLLPLGVSILKDSECYPTKSNFGRCLMIAIVWGSLIGGTATPSGCGPNILAIQYVRDMAGMNVTFLDWMIVGVPGAFMMLPCAWFLLLKVFPPEFKEIPTTLDSIKQELHDLGGLKTAEIKTLTVFLIMVFLWLCGPSIAPFVGFPIPESYVALLGFTLLFVPGFRVFSTWEDANKSISWSGLVLIAGGIAAGVMLAETGAARYIAWGLLSDIGGFHPLMRVVAVVCLVEVLKVFFSSNSVTGAVVVPLIIALALEIGINPWVLAGPAGIATSMAFIMVTSSPTNVIPYSAGYFTIPDFAKVGIGMTIIAILCVTVSVAVFGPFAQMNIW